MHEKREFPAGKDKVWRAREVFDVKPEPIPQTVRGAPNDQLRLRSLRADTTHHLGTTGG